jgi:hypothetical protein
VINSIIVTSVFNACGSREVFYVTPLHSRVEDNDSVDHVCVCVGVYVYVCLRVRQEETCPEPLIGRVTPKLYHIRALMLRLTPHPSAVFSLGIYQFLKSSDTDE